MRLLAILAMISGQLKANVATISRRSHGARRFSDVTACSMTRSLDWGESLRLAAALAGERPVAIDRTRATLLPLFQAEGKARAEWFVMARQVLSETDTC